MTTTTSQKVAKNKDKWKPHKTLAIALHSFKFRHFTTSNHDTNTNDDGFIGRKEILKRLVNLLKETQNSRGCYLISGYRGVGKTSVVEHAINKYSREPNKKVSLFYSKPKHTIKIPVNLGECKRISPQELYYTISNILYEATNNHIKHSHRVLSKTFFYIALFCLLVSILPLIHHFNSSTNSTFITILSDIPSIKSFYVVLISIGIMSFGLYSRGHYVQERIIGRLERLLQRIHSEVIESANTSIYYGWFSFGQNKSVKYLPIKAREIEYELKTILEDLRDPRIFGADIIFIFDEIDKLSERSIYENETDRFKSDAKANENESAKQERVNDLLGSLKYFITTAQARFIFISGRETLDRYYSERGSANSLYESLFDQVFEVPSLLSDSKHITKSIEEYVCQRIHSNIFSLNDYYVKLKEQIKNTRQSKLTKDKLDQAKLTIAILRNFVYYLTFHSWGNPKRLASIFESFVTSETPNDKMLHTNLGWVSEDYHYLIFNFQHQRSLMLAGNIFNIFQHQLSREVSRIGDKLTVSSLSSLQFILKLHPYGFTRESLHRMSEAINIHRAPELNVIVDDLLSQVFKSYIRRVRNGAYRYRFNSGFEQELRYITHVSELESASYNFSLGAMSRVKSYFENDLIIAKEQKSEIVSVKSHITLGDMSAIEQSYNSASMHYSAAILILTEKIKFENKRLLRLRESGSKNTFWSEVELLMLYADVMLKFGDLEEHRLNYNKAAGIYMQAHILILDTYINSCSNLSESDLICGDSKWDLFKQPYWAYKFLSLKRSPPAKKDKGKDKANCKINDNGNLSIKEWNSYTPISDTPPPPDEGLFDKCDPRFYFRQANLDFYMGWSEVDQGIINYFKTIHLANRNFTLSSDGIQNERRDYLVASSLTAIVDSTLIKKSASLYTTNHKDLDYLKEDLLKLLYEENFKVQEIKIKKSTITIDGLKRFNERKEDILGTGNTNLICLLEAAADTYARNNLYVSAALTHMKIISYILMIIDVFGKDNYSNKELEDEDNLHDNKSNELKLKFLYEKIYKPQIDKSLKDSIIYIDLARQLESSQLIKTLSIMDYDDDTPDGENPLLSQLLELCISGEENSSEDYPIHSDLFWQHSLWGQKIAALAYWAEFVRSKLIKSYTPNILDKFNPTIMPTISIRSSIMMRWIYARHVHYKYFENSDDFVLKNIDQREKEPQRYSELSLNIDATLEDDKIPHSELWSNAYNITRTLYFDLLDIRLISRNNLDLIYPTMPHIYYVHWRLLSSIAKTILIDFNANSKKIETKFRSMRDISLYMQTKFRQLDKLYSNTEIIAPSHFDYEYITKKIMVHLNESISLIDQTSRYRTNILQHKYFAHDDHSDQEFRLDWTLSNMFAPSAKFMLENVAKVNEEITSLLRQTI